MSWQYGFGGSWRFGQGAGFPYFGNYQNQTLYPTTSPQMYAPYGLPSGHWLTQQWGTAPQTDNQSLNANAPSFTPQQPARYPPPSAHPGIRTANNSIAPFSPSYIPPPPPTPSPPPPPPTPPAAKQHIPHSVPRKPYIPRQPRAKFYTPSVSDQSQQYQEQRLPRPSPTYEAYKKEPSPAPRSPKKPNKHLIKRPQPTASYLRRANQDPVTTTKPRRLLVVLDLNGTLLHRANKGIKFTSRPWVSQFLWYLLAYHNVMVWSSATRKNVQGTCDKLFEKDQKDRLVAIWARDTLRLPAEAYNQKVQVYKQLSWVWRDIDVQTSSVSPDDEWDQDNTVLIDDSVEKAASEPHNLIKIDEFEGTDEEKEMDVLGQVVEYLEKLRMEENVSAYIRETSFVYDADKQFDWMEIVNDMHA